jgi:hypothetical protein
MVSVIAIGPKVRVFKPGRGSAYLRAIKIQFSFAITRK